MFKKCSNLNNRSEDWSQTYLNGVQQKDNNHWVLLIVYSISYMLPVIPGEHWTIKSCVQITDKELETY